MVKLLIGIDDESPYGALARTAEGKKVLDKNISLLEKLTTLFEKHDAKRTFFIVGDYIQNSLDINGQDALINIFASQSPNTEIAQHTYNHVLIAPLSTRPDKIPVTKEVLAQELAKTNAILYNIFGVKPAGLKTPLSFPTTLPDDVADTIQNAGLSYVSSNGRSASGGLNAPLVENGIVRQPSFYKNGLLEVPTQGWQDSAFTGTSKTLGTTGYPTTIKDIVAHYTGILGQAQRFERTAGKELVIAFAMHPQAIAQYDPELKVLENILSYAKSNNVELIKHKELI